MRKLCAVLLALGMFLSHTNGLGLSTLRHNGEDYTSKMTTTVRSDNDSEERGDVPGLSKIAELAAAKVSTSEKLHNSVWLELKKSPKDIFDKLRLGETGVKLGDNPKFLQWLRYLKAYQSIHEWLAYQQMYVLLKKTPEDELARLFHSMEQVPSLKNAAVKLQNGQVDHWINGRKQPEEVLKLLKLDQTELTLDNNPVMIQWLTYTSMYFKKNEVLGVDKVNQLLLKTTRGKKLVVVLQSLEETSIRYWAHSLQAALFKKWKETPDMAARVFGFKDLKSALKVESLESDTVRAFWIAYQLR